MSDTHLLEVDLVRAPPYLCRSPLRSDCKHHDFISQLLISPMLNPPQKQIVKTIENTREADETVCRPDDEEFFSDIDAEEFNLVLRREVTPKGCFRCCCLSCVTAPKPRCHFVDPYPFKVMFQTSMGPFGCWMARRSRIAHVAEEKYAEPKEEFI
ncbi:hypothetical protein Bca52824_029874 [Brassica carinata]|uniref:Uncharacterized protein n=1 Tax=Brassica carinata TaxID=52824 RepID=A0A8X7S574_BRACI|nr:hypothetical protein Bca52824_029874 [Brassica carinata]